MTVFVDNVKIKYKGYQWCHLVADNLDELHSFARSLGISKKWFQIDGSYPHYDITVGQREVALRKGALNGTRREIITCAKKLKLEFSRLHKANELQLLLF